MKKSKEEIMDRRDKVMTTLLQEGEVRVEALARKLHVSQLTIRRDLQYLNQQNKLQRFFGGATVSEKGISEEESLVYYKNLIAKKAAALVNDEDTIFINTSSTAILMLKYIEADNVTVITNNGKAIRTPRGSNVSVVLTGGELRGMKEAMVGDFATSNVTKVLANKSFLGCSGFSDKTGMTTENLNEVVLNELMIERVSEKVYILADHSKIGKDSSFISCPPEKVSVLITDEHADTEILSGIKEHGIEVIVAHDE